MTSPALEKSTTTAIPAGSRIEEIQKSIQVLTAEMIKSTHSLFKANSVNRPLLEEGILLPAHRVKAAADDLQEATDENDQVRNYLEVFYANNQPEEPWRQFLDEKEAAGFLPFVKAIGPAIELFTRQYRGTGDFRPVTVVNAYMSGVLAAHSWDTEERKRV